MAEPYVFSFEHIRRQVRWANVSVDALNGNVLREHPSPFYNKLAERQATIFRGGTLWIAKSSWLESPKKAEELNGFIEAGMSQKEAMAQIGVSLKDLMAAAVLALCKFK